MRHAFPNMAWGCLYDAFSPGAHAFLDLVLTDPGGTAAFIVLAYEVDVGIRLSGAKPCRQCLVLGDLSVQDLLTEA